MMIRTLLLLLAQATETHDLATFEPPAGKKGELGTSLTWTEVAGPSFCQIMLAKSAPGSGDAAKDFDAEWDALIAKPYTVKGERKAQSAAWPGGWTLTMAAAPVHVEPTGDFVSVLAVFSGHGVRVPVLVNFNDEKYQERAGKFLDSVKLAKPAAPPPKPAEPDRPDVAPSYKARPWRKALSQYSNWGYNPTLAELAKTTNQGYSRWTYVFAEDGTYEFKGEFFSMNKHTEYWWHEESGSYVQDGERLTLKPKKSERILRDKEKKAVADPTPVPLEEATYRWTMHYFSGIGEWNLILTPVSGEQTKRDGTFSMNPLFPKSYILSKPPEAR
jgi:hypothetical protein